MSYKRMITAVICVMLAAVILTLGCGNPAPESVDTGNTDLWHLEFDKRIVLNPNDTLAYLQRGYYYMYFKNDYDNAITDYTKAIEIDPKYADAYQSRGDTYYYAKGDYDRAIADYTKAIEIEPEDFTNYAKRGLAYSKKGEKGKAEADYIKAQQKALQE